MNRKRIGENSNRTIAFGASIGIAVSVILSMMLAAILAFMIVNESTSEAAMNYFSFFILMISTFLGSLAASKIIMRRYALVAAIVALVYLLILTAITILFFDSAFHGLWTGIAAIALGSVVSCAVCISVTGKRTKRKYRSR